MAYKDAQEHWIATAGRPQPTRLEFRWWTTKALPSQQVYTHPAREKVPVRTWLCITAAFTPPMNSRPLRSSVRGWSSVSPSQVCPSSLLRDCLTLLVRSHFKLGGSGVICAPPSNTLRPPLHLGEVRAGLNRNGVARTHPGTTNRWDPGNENHCCKCRFPVCNRPTSQAEE